MFSAHCLGKNTKSSHAQDSKPAAASALSQRRHSLPSGASYGFWRVAALLLLASARDGRSADVEILKRELNPEEAGTAALKLLALASWKTDPTEPRATTHF